MASGIVALCFDACDPLLLARFWAEALGWDVAEGAGPGGGDVALVPTDGTRFTLRFTPVSEAKAGKNPIHLDLTTTSLDDQRAMVERLLSRGARHADVGQSPDEPHVVLADPEGNELCIIEPGNTFLAGCGRFGSITCDGSVAVGRFWAAALVWPLVWDQDGETAVRAPDGTGPFLTWGPPVPERGARRRLRLEVAAVDGDQQAEVERLVALGAVRVDTAVGQGDPVVMADPDGNLFCVLARTG